jgi:polysaccharide biosynthesis protein PelE
VSPPGPESKPAAPEPKPAAAETKPASPDRKFIGVERMDQVMGAVALGSPLPLYLLGLVLEALATLTLLMDLVAEHRLEAFLLMHFLGSAISGLALFRWMPRLLRRRRFTAYPSLCVVVFFLPLLGALGLGVGLVLPLLLPHKVRNEAPIVSTFIPDLPYRPLVVSSQPIYGVVGLVGVIRHAAETAARVRAVMATRQLSDQYAVPILQVALRDPVDDVRLLAYALLDGKERAIYGNIKQLNGRLADAPKATHGGLHKRLAHEHWELVYLGMAQGEVLAHVLTAGLKHALLATEELPSDAGLCFLLGRMKTAQGNLEEASAHFDRAEAMGLPRQTLLSYRADIAFRQRRWDDVRTLLAGLPAESKKRMPLSAVVAFWGAA